MIALDNGGVIDIDRGTARALPARPAVIISESGTGGYRIGIPDKTGFKGVTVR